VDLRAGGASCGGVDMVHCQSTDGEVAEILTQERRKDDQSNRQMEAERPEENLERKKNKTKLGIKTYW